MLYLIPLDAPPPALLDLLFGFSLSLSDELELLKELSEEDEEGDSWYFSFLVLLLSRRFLHQSEAHSINSETKSSRSIISVIPAYCIAF